MSGEAADVVVEDEEEEVDVDGFDDVKKERIDEGLLTLEQIDPEEEEIWTVTVPSHVRPLKKCLKQTQIILK